jgi:hypothetical protein
MNGPQAMRRGMCCADLPEHKNLFCVRACTHVQQFYFIADRASAVRRRQKSFKLRPLIALGETVKSLNVSGGKQAA